MKICVLPNDSLLSYYKKGELKTRYFNPCNFFDEVHIVSLFDEEIEEEKVKNLAGNGKLIIHKLGKVNLLNYKNYKKKVYALIKDIAPDIVRSFNGTVIGWLAVSTSNELEIPVVVSLHTNYEQQRLVAKKEKKFLQFLKLSYVSKKIEKFVLSNSDAVICVYNYIVPYALKMNAKNIHVIYNKVDLQQFSPYSKPVLKSNRPIVLTVGRLINQKDHRLLINAVKELDVDLVIIGDGPNYNTILNLIKYHNLESRIKIIKKVNNSELGGYFTSAQIYAQPLINLEGIPIPVLEAMACGLPVVMSKHSESYSEIIDKAVIYVDNTSDSFKNAFQRILMNDELKNELKEKALKVIDQISGDKMEIKELNLYKQLLKSK